MGSKTGVCFLNVQFDLFNCFHCGVFIHRCDGGKALALVTNMFRRENRLIDRIINVLPGDVLRGNDPSDARGVLSGGNVNALDVPFVDRAPQYLHVQHPRKLDVIHISRRTSYMTYSVISRYRFPYTFRQILSLLFHPGGDCLNGFNNF